MLRWSGGPRAMTTGDTRLVAVPFSRQRVVFCLHPDHHWAHRDGIRLTELSGEPLIMREPGSISRLALEEALATANVDANVVLEVNREGVWEAAAAGLGVGVTTEVEFRPDDRLKMLHVVDADVETEAIVVSLRDRQEAPLVRTFMDIATEMADFPTTAALAPSSRTSRFRRLTSRTGDRRHVTDARFILDRPSRPLAAGTLFQRLDGIEHGLPRRTGDVDQIGVCPAHLDQLGVVTSSSSRTHVARRSVRRARARRLGCERISPAIPLEAAASDPLSGTDPAAVRDRPR